jgi:ribosome maturation factor RimP
LILDGLVPRQSQALTVEVGDEIEEVHMGSTDSLAGLARPLLAQAGLDLWDIEVGPSRVRILVDRPGGVDLDALSAATGVLSPLLDEREDLVPAGRYDLEVSSPGIERTLRTVDHFRGYVGSLLALKTKVAMGGARRLRATLVAVADDAIDVVIEGSPQPVTVPLDQIERARTVLEWGPQPGKPKANNKSGSGRRARPAQAARAGANHDKDSAS